MSNQALPTPIDGGGGGGGAPTSAQYVTLATDATLSNERVLTAGANVTLTDAGAGSTVTVAALAGAMVLNIVTTSANYNFADTDCIVLANPTSNQTLSLPWAGLRSGRVLTIKRVAVNGFTVTVNTGGENIDGSTSILLSGYDSVTVISDGTNWRVI
jgi:hypothetical protein